ncbi:MAG: acetoacetate--CoA ligase [Calditrichia bacterium]
MTPPLWSPSATFKQNSRLNHFMQWLSEKHQLIFQSYHELWEWSVDDTKLFWQMIWDYFEIISHSAPSNVHTDDPMPNTRWFEGATLNYAEHIFRMSSAKRPAIIFQSEAEPLGELSWDELEERVAAFQAWLREQGIGKGDRVVAYLPNIPEATIAFLATCSLGAVWSSCSPDFGADSVVDRFQQIEPKLLITVDGYRYGGKGFDKSAVVDELILKLSTLEGTLLIPFLDKTIEASRFKSCTAWSEALSTPAQKLEFLAVPFDHPIWILYSSGTTGIPKAITHSQGGVLLEHLRYVAFHNDVHPGERFFWYSTTGWMMWNFVQATLLAGATIVLYDGSPNYPDINFMWQFAEEVGIHHFGTSAPFLVACMKAGISPKDDFDLSALRSIGSTGAPLPPEAFSWVYENVNHDLWLCSMSGGTDVCTAFVGGCPLEPVYVGEIQCRTLGCSMYAFDESAEPVVDEVGEMVITKPMPSMPIYFWNDPGKTRYLASYFEMYRGIWRHGDWLKVTPRNTLLILGRSDATLNRHGIRIGTAEIYRALNSIAEIQDSLIVNLELSGGRHYMPLFVKLTHGCELNENLINLVKKTLRSTYSPRHVPDEIIPVSDIPYTISGKKLEAPVKKILMGIPIDRAANPDAMRNPETLDFYVNFAENIK